MGAPKPSIELAFGGPPKGAPKDDYGADDGDKPEGDDESSEGLDTACSEFLDAAGIQVPPEKLSAACEALKNFVSMVKAG